jgi:hypothetical protein
LKKTLKKKLKKKIKKKAKKKVKKLLKKYRRGSESPYQVRSVPDQPCVVQFFSLYLDSSGVNSMLLVSRDGEVREVNIVERYVPEFWHNDV